MQAEQQPVTSAAAKNKKKTKKKGRPGAKLERAAFAQLMERKHDDQLKQKDRGDAGAGDDSGNDDVVELTAAAMIANPSLSYEDAMATATATAASVSGSKHQLVG